MIYEMFRNQFVPQEKMAFLPGGQIRGPVYFIVTEDDDVFRGPFQTQSATQISPEFPKGYEPLLLPHGEEKLCIATNTI